MRTCELLAVAALGLVLAVPSGCHRESRAARSAAAVAGGRPTAVVHEDCAIKNAQERLDANGDGKPDVSVVTKDGKRVCQAVDFNFDGVVDVWTYFDAGGQIRRREYAFGPDPRITEIRIFAGGEPREIQQATVSSNQLDTWHRVEGGRVVLTERDANGDGKIDEWWEYPHADKPGCPMMYSDTNGDAKRDDAGVDLCAQGYTPPARDEYRYKSPEFRRAADVPTEVSNRELPDGEKAGEEKRDAK